MRITDELRECADKLDEEAAMMSEHGFSPLGMRLERIANRIDEAVAGEYVRLPKDADEETIHPDDELIADNGDTLAGRVTGIGVGGRDGWVWTLLDGNNVSRACKASVLHHYHEPTVHELNPCPFCGGAASFHLYYGGRYRVHCNECGCHLEGLFDTKTEAIDAWNRRAER